MKTLIRILLAVVVIVFLTLLLWPWRTAPGRVRSRVAIARSDVNAIEASIRAYYLEYGKFPVPNSQQNIPDKTYGSNEVFQITNTLQAIPKGWNANHALNPKGIVFLTPSFSRNAVDSAGRMLDPWGTIYWIRLDNNHDNKVIYSNAVYSVTNDSVSIAVSFGPDGKPSEDDINSAR